MRAPTSRLPSLRSIARLVIRFELTAYVDEDDFTPNAPQQGNIYVRRTVETRLAVNPVQMKLLHELIGQQLKTYEHGYGKIPLPQEIQSRFAEMTKNQSSPTTTARSTKPSVGIQ